MIVLSQQEPWTWPSGMSTQKLTKSHWKILSEQFNDNQFDKQIFVYPGGGYYYPGMDMRD